jgi:hypothetical protein
MIRFVLTVLALLLSLPAYAQEPASDGQSLLAFAANNTAFDNRVEMQAKHIFPRFFAGCTSINQAVRQLPTAYGAISFPLPSQMNRFPAPNDGIWAEHVKIRACDKVRQINMLAVSRRDGEPVLLTLLPGETRADPAIQREAERIGATTITKADGETCSDTPVAFNTRILGYAQAGGVAGLAKQDTGNGWFEEWSYRFCQKDVAVQMAFMPNDMGAFDVKARMPEAPAAPKAEAKPDATEAAKAAAQAQIKTP